MRNSRSSKQNRSNKELGIRSDIANENVRSTFWTAGPADVHIHDQIEIDKVLECIKHITAVL